MALARVAETVADWEGGTRIGESLREFLARTGHRGAARGATVVVCSDGLDVGDPELLRAQMERLARLAHRTVWLNPLKQDPAYEPLARGMHAALPYVDVFASGHDLASLEAVARSSATVPRRPFRHDAPALHALYARRRELTVAARIRASRRPCRPGGLLPGA